MLLLLFSCSTTEWFPTESIVNRWWHLEDENYNFYLEWPSYALWYNVYIPRDNLEDNIYVGTWGRYVGSNSFILDVYGMEFEVDVEIAEEDDCYKLKYNAFLSDLACPYISPVWTDER